MEGRREKGGKKEGKEGKGGKESTGKGRVYVEDKREE